MAINAGPVFKPNPSISFTVTAKSLQESDDIWKVLSQDAIVMMKFQKYPFSEKYGILEDKFGVSWQISYNGDTEKTDIKPSLMFVGQNNGKAEEAINHYLNIFKNSKLITLSRNGENSGSDKPQDVSYAVFELEGVQFTALDSATDFGFNFKEGISLIVNCDDQVEVDYYWDKLSEGGDPKAQQCGWLKDKYGLSWQIIPVQLGSLMSSGDSEKIKRVTSAFLKMKKFDIQALENA
jgi:predicted 3-demethylubiquinone-9 3-methyltransferase (glyoxalase superfamily)